MLGYVLEKFIPSIIELTPEKMYYDGVPLLTTINIENKPFGSGNISVQTGCSEDLVFPIPFEEKINQISFPPIIDEMARQHKGLFIWDASLLISKKDGKNTLFFYSVLLFTSSNVRSLGLKSENLFITLSANNRASSSVDSLMP